MAKLRAVECREFIKAVVEKAEEMRVPVAIAIVNAEGRLLALERMDDAGFITPKTAESKAYTVAAFRSMSPRFTDGLVIQTRFTRRSDRATASFNTAPAMRLRAPPVAPPPAWS